MRKTVPLLASLAMTMVSLCVAPHATAHGELHARIERLSSRIESTPHDVELLFTRAELHRLHADPIAALLDLERASTLAPDHVELHAGRARTHLDRGALADAIAAADRWISLAPTDLGARRVRALIHVARGDVDAADADYEAACVLPSPPPPDVWIERARMLADATEAAEKERALQVIDRGIERLGPVVSLELEAITLERSAGRIEAALARIDAITDRVDRKEPWLARRGDVLADAGRIDEARAAYRTALDAFQTLSRKRRSTASARELQAHLRTRLQEFRP